MTSLGHDIYLYDQRGSGLSDRLPKFSDVGFVKHVNDLIEIVSERINANKVILIGQSFGCAIISNFSARASPFGRENSVQFARRITPNA